MMAGAWRDILEMLEPQGFEVSEEWALYAHQHGMRRVSSVHLPACPECDSKDAKPMGQYVYYSTLCRLMDCQQCGLVYSDRRIDPQVLQEHFERAYKDDAYFEQRRDQIFSQMVALADQAAPVGGRVLDIGGAKGHLLNRLRQVRPDLRLICNDLSKDACAWAASTYGLETAQGGLDVLEGLPGRFDVVILSDVIYYEPDLPRLWRVLQWLVSPQGTILIRIPHKLPMIRLASWLRRSPMQDDMRGYNPEHLYALSPGYLVGRLRSIGFTHCTVKPSPLLGQRRGSLAAAWYTFSRWIGWATGGAVITTPSLVVVARR